MVDGANFSSKDLTVFSYLYFVVSNGFDSSVSNTDDPEPGTNI